MDREIGSIYEINRDCFGYEDNLDDYIFKDMLSKGYKDWCSVSCARDALVLAILQIEKKIKKNIKCMLPMYICDSIDSVFDYYGWELNYYPIKKDMQPDEKAFELMLEEVAPEVLFIHGYYGVNNIKAIMPLLRKYQNNGGIIIEDITQYIGEKREYIADYYIASLRKWAAIPDGGLIVSKDSILYKPISVRSDFVRQKWISLTKKQDYLDMCSKQHSDYEVQQSIKKEFLDINKNAEEILDNDHNIYAMSNLAIHLWNNSDIEKTLRIRSENANYLYENISKIKGIISPIKYTGHEAPLYYPIYVENRDLFQAYMSQRNIYVPVLWPISDLNTELIEDTRYIYNHLLGLPCDSRYDKADMKRIVSECKEAIKNINNTK